MTEPKTLEDLECEDIHDLADRDYIEENYTINIKELRQEAIKWIKKFKEENHKEGYIKLEVDGVPYYSNPTQQDLSPVMRFIKQFFNITEQDIEEFEE